MKVKFTWDKQKEKENKKKHGISFEEAATIFHNFPLEIFYDPEHSMSENRYIAVGFSDKGRVLLVVHCENSKGTEIRIISARKTTPKEKRKVFGGK
ncbi:BrnT family toxin [Bdellovibrionota bacterium]